MEREVLATGYFKFALGCPQLLILHLQFDLVDFKLVDRPPQLLVGRLTA